MREIRKPASVFIALLFSCTLSAQTDGVGTWNVLSGKYTFNKQWSVFAEGQVRSQQFYRDFHYHEYKAGVNYNLQKNVSFLFAMGHYATYQPVGDFKTPSTTEFRIWEQLVLNNNINRLKLEHRYRVEQRFLSSGEYRNRFRYRLNASLPFGRKEIEKNTLYASAYNEVFLCGEEQFFEQNRIFGGLGYQADDHLTILAGLVHRFDNIAPRVHAWKNFFQINFFFSFGETKSGRERHPSALD